MAWFDLHCGGVRRLRCSCLLAAVAAMGCSDAPSEGPVADAKPLAPHAPSAVVLLCDHSSDGPSLVPLPSIDESAAAVQSDQITPPPVVPIAGPSLLPPVDLAMLDYAEVSTEAHQSSAPPTNLIPQASPPQTGPAVDAANSQLEDNPHIVQAQQLLADAADANTGSPTGVIVAERAQAKIRRGYALAQRGASFAARNEFIEVLRMIAEAKDQKHGAARRTIALANGMRALEEAADFAPAGVDVDAELDVNLIVSSHRTPVAKELPVAQLMPQQLADLYFRYAQLQLAGAVAGEPAGSMALHALGKVYSQLGRTERESNPQAERRAFALQQAALLARDDNHLAAHELGVLLAEAGHYVESDHLLAQVAARQPHPVVFRNWARVQRKLGRTHLAIASEQHAQALAARGAAGGPVTWVTPNQLAQTGDATGAPAPSAHVASGPAIPQPKAATPTPPTVQNVSRLPGGYMR